MAVAAIAVALAQSACAGPQRPFELGLKEVPSDLLLGAQTKPALALPTQLPPMVFTVTDLVTPPPPFEDLPPPIPEPPPPPSPCPEADPLAAVRKPAELEILKPPAPATYTYRTSGVYFANGRDGTLPPTATHVIGNVNIIGPGEFTFTVAVTQEPRTTTTTYHVVPRTSAAIPPGLYISKVDGSGLTPFQPKPELLLLPFPALKGTTFTAAGSDGLTTLSYSGVVEETERIDACGEPVDGIRVTLTDGKATSARSDGTNSSAETFEAAYVIATQYGGLSIRDFLNGAGAGGLGGRELHGVISQVPKDTVQ
jgi:hypothetical protein